MKNWEIKGQLKKITKDREAEIISVLLKNRGLVKKSEMDLFLNPPKPDEYSLADLKIDKKEVTKTISRLKVALKKKEDVVVYGDYDADGICATAILWEGLFSLGFRALPYIPERFSEGYGINAESVGDLKKKNPKLKLLFTVDNGITAGKEIEKINKLGIDVVVVDHHVKAKTKPKAFSIIHTTQICAASLAFVLVRELKKHFKTVKANTYGDGLELAAIATIADQTPLIGANRSFAKYGLEALNKTKRPGLTALINDAALTFGGIGTYEVGFIIAPRINAMGRIEHAIDSLRILCTKDTLRAKELAYHIGKVNLERQRIVDEVIYHAREVVLKDSKSKVLILAHETYHEGVIGLAAGKLVEEFYRPAIVISSKGEIAKGSARSISGFNMIETIQKMEKFILGGGGHPMAAGFSLKTTDIEIFKKEFIKLADPLLTEEILTKKAKVDLEINLSDINLELYKKLKDFEPTGLGNPSPSFITKGVEVADAKTVGKEGKHLKLKVKQGDSTFDAIAFKRGESFKDLSVGKKIDIVYSLDEDTWGGNLKLQLKIKDLDF
jgi:single-stranded-DNA-specific exonuclease